MALRVYEYEKCSTCRKALKFLEAKGVAFEAVPIVDNPPSSAELKAMAAKVGLKRLFNTSGVQYRELGISERLPSMSEAEAIALLAKNGKLVKRPFVPAKGLVGFKEDEWKAAFK